MALAWERSFTSCTDRVLPCPISCGTRSPSFRSVSGSGPTCNRRAWSSARYRGARHEAAGADRIRGAPVKHTVGSAQIVVSMGNLHKEFMPGEYYDVFHWAGIDVLSVINGHDASRMRMLLLPICAGTLLFPYPVDLDHRVIVPARNRLTTFVVKRASGLSKSFQATAPR